MLDASRRCGSCVEFSATTEKTTSPGLRYFKSLRTRHQFALWRKNRGDSNQILRGDAGVPQCQLKRSKTFAMFADPLGEENLLGDHVFRQFEFPPVALG